MDFLIQTSLNTVSVTSNFIYFVINVFFQLSLKSSISFLTVRNFLIYISLYLGISFCTISNFLIQLFGNSSQFLGNCSCKVWVITQSICNLLQSIKNLWSFPNNLFNSCLKICFSLITSIIDKLRYFCDIISMFFNAIQFSLENIGKVVFSKRIDS